MARRVALLIGTSDYSADPGLRTLVAPAQDTERLARLLADPQIGGFETRVLNNEKAAVAREAIEELLVDCRPDDLAVLYFSGHGVKDFHDNHLYLAFTNTRLKLLESTAIPAEFINKVMLRSPARRQLLLLDCCYSGAFARGMTVKAGDGVNTREYFPSVGRGQGRAILTASDAMQYALEGETATGQGVQSVFTRILADGLETGAADLDGDGQVDLEELYDYILGRMAEEAPAQKPNKVLALSGKLYLARTPRPARAGQPLMARLEADLADPNSAARLKAVDELVRLWRGDDPAQSQLARRLLERVRDDEDQIRRVSRAAGQALGELSTKPLTQLYEVKDLKPASQPASVPPAAAGPIEGVAGPAESVTLALTKNLRLDLLRIPAGEFLMGSDPARDNGASQDETPQHKLYLPEYLIGKTPITVAQFSAFAQAAKYKWNYLYDTRAAKDPVTEVNWRDALAFCEWASAVSGQRVSLPSEAEWEKAARGVDGRLYPWGNAAPTNRHCNFGGDLRGVTPVGRYSPLGDSPYGCVDMAGNVSEWCRSRYGAYPFLTDDGRDDLAGKGTRAMRGGSFHDTHYRTLLTTTTWV